VRARDLGSSAGSFRHGAGLSRAGDPQGTGTGSSFSLASAGCVRSILKFVNLHNIDMSGDAILKMQNGW